jgi:hypothetical protein
VWIIDPNIYGIAALNQACGLKLKAIFVIHFTFQVYMPSNLNPNEKELIRLVSFFKKKADNMIREGKLSAEHEQVIISCDKLAETIQVHAQNRHDVLEQRELLKNLVKDHAVCPRCEKSAHLKLTGTDKSEEGWKSNKYRCKRCNIEFVWNRPNNPWDLLPYIEREIGKLEEAIKMNANTGEAAAPAEMLEQMRANVEKLKPVIDASDAAFRELESREEEMARLVHEFRNHLLIEKIKMDTYPGARNTGGVPPEAN